MDPVLSGGNPTGAFSLATGTPYTATGVPGGTTGQWQSLTITFKDGSNYTFTPSAGSINLYLWSRMANVAGKSVLVKYDASNRLTSVVNDAASPLSMLTFAYTGANLATVTDAYGCQVTYTFGSASDTNVPGMVLKAASQINAAASALWQYDYQAIGGQPFLNSVTTANPTGMGMSMAATTQFDTSGRVAKMVDAEGNQRTYIYNSGATQISVYNKSNALVQHWTQKFGPLNLDTGITDAASNSSAITYGDGSNPRKPTQVQNRDGQHDTRTYDQYGDLLTVADLRGVVTTYTYTPGVPGQVASIQTGTRPPPTLPITRGTCRSTVCRSPMALSKRSPRPRPAPPAPGHR